MPGRLCPHCGSPVAAGVKFCTSCGERVPARTPEPRRYEEPSEPGPLLYAALWFLDLFPGLVRPGVVICSAVALAIAGGLFVLAGWIFMLGAVFSAFFIGAAAVIVYWAALCWLMHGQVVLPVEALIDFDGRKWWAFILLTLTPVALLFAYASRLTGR
jgi:hypothetical protein